MKPVIHNDNKASQILDEITREHQVRVKAQRKRAHTKKRARTALISIAALELIEEQEDNNEYFALRLRDREANPK